jgi:hypothetical protein
MALLDFIKARNQQQAATKPAPATPKPEAQKDVTKVLSASQLAEFRAVGERLQQATAHLRGHAPQVAAGDGGHAALLQKQNNQDKTQAALSPTDRAKGQTVTQQRARGWVR